MEIGDIFQKRKENLNLLLQMRKKGPIAESVECPKCHEKISEASLTQNNYICPNCHYYFPMTAKQRIDLIADKNSFRALFSEFKSKDPLNFPGYEEKLQKNRERTGSFDAAVTGVIKIEGISAAIGILDSRFLMGSMGTVVGEQITRLAEYARKKKLPLILFSASGGARMQEGLFSLMQMAKTAAAVEKLKKAGILYISCLTDPTTGGVSASFANLGDIILAEPNALICFAGPRVIEQTIGEKLSDGFQRAEFLLEHGMIDRIVERDEMKRLLHRLLILHQKG